jgi:hypothetical protein
MLQECYKSVTRVLQERDKSVTRVLQECYKDVTRERRGTYITATTRLNEMRHQHIEDVWSEVRRILVFNQCYVVKHTLRHITLRNVILCYLMKEAQHIEDIGSGVRRILVLRVLRGCYKSVRRVSQKCYNGVIRVKPGRGSPGHDKAPLAPLPPVTRVSQSCYKYVERVSQECYKGVSMVLQGCCMDVTRVPV